MNNRFLFSIRTQMLILIIVMSLAPIGIIIFSAVQELKYDEQNARLIAERLCNEIGNQQNAKLSGAEQLMSSFAYIPCIKNRDAKATSILLAELLEKNPQISNIAISDITGLAWASGVPLSGKTLGNDRRFFKNAMATGNFSSGEYTIGRVLKKPSIQFGYPIKDTSGKIRDIANVAFALESYKQLLTMNKLPDNTSLVLTDHKGTILFNATGPDFIGKKDKEEIFKIMTEGSDKGSFEDIGITGNHRYFAYQKLRMNNEQTPYMYVRTGILKEFVSRKIRNQLMLNIGSMVAITLLVIGFALYISKRAIVDKIIALRNAAQQVGKGNLDVHVSDYVSGGELGELGLTFDEMARKLAEDLSNRKQIEEQIYNSLREKEVLLKEIHHRVKNNMQVIYSLLNLQAKGIADSQVRSMFEESRDRINSMALIHENLYQSEDLAHIDFKKYLQTLVKGIAGTYSRHEVNISVEMEPIALDVNVGIPCGLIVNELVSNSFKYAFPEGRKGTITVGINRNSEGNYRMTVADNGIGFPAYLDFRKTKTLGMQLVTILTVQIRGTIELVTTEGTHFSITFPGQTDDRMET